MEIARVVAGRRFLQVLVPVLPGCVLGSVPVLLRETRTQFVTCLGQVRLDI